ncbi:hypothetical protein NEOC95_001717 [Neochlamydia sp. AcF95]|nr:hypothetical protein [Neochlamydia sp. AcF95]
MAKREKNSIGHFYGFKLHLAINDRGEMFGLYVNTMKCGDPSPCV